MANKKYEESSIQAIANAIRTKNGSSTTYKVADMADAVLAIQTKDSMSLGRSIKANTSGSTSAVTTDFTIAANTKEAYLVVDTIFYGNDNTISLARQSGAAVTISTLQSSTLSNFDSFGHSPIRLRTITYKILKTNTTSAVVRLSVSNPYGLGGICSHIVSI